MYESFGASVDQNAKAVTFRVFFPDNALDPSQYQRGGLPHIAQMKVVGDFQSQIGANDWDIDTAPVMRKEQYQNKGWLYSYNTGPLAKQTVWRPGMHRGRKSVTSGRQAR